MSKRDEKGEPCTNISGALAFNHSDQLTSNDDGVSLDSNHEQKANDGEDGKHSHPNLNGRCG